MVKTLIADAGHHGEVHRLLGPHGEGGHNQESENERTLHESSSIGVENAAAVYLIGGGRVLVGFSRSQPWFFRTRYDYDPTRLRSGRPHPGRPAHRPPPGRGPPPA